MYVWNKISVNNNIDVVKILCTTGMAAANARIHCDIYSMLIGLSVEATE